jgi:hypothetical protein
MVPKEGLKGHGLSCLRLDGSTPVPRRKDLVQTFQNSTGRSWKRGGTAAVPDLPARISSICSDKLYPRD